MMVLGLSFSVLGCGDETDEGDGDILATSEEGTGEEAPSYSNELAVSGGSNAISCPSGWHPHKTAWSPTGFYNYGSCTVKHHSLNAGWEVCMKNGTPWICGGQGFSEVYRPGYDNTIYMARMEAFTGH